MPGNIIGYHAANYRKWQIADAKYSAELERKRQQLEIDNNKTIWAFTLDYLKKIDPSGWEVWYDSPDLPDWKWSGDCSFQVALGILWGRICKIKETTHETSQHTGHD